MESHDLVLKMMRYNISVPVTQVIVSVSVSTEYSQAAYGIS